MKGDATDCRGTAQPGPAGLRARWWKTFGSADLDRVMDQALAGNPTVAEADASLERLRQQAARRPRRPAAAGRSQRRRRRRADQHRLVRLLGFPGFPNPTLGLYSIGGTVSYDVDLFGGLRRASEAAAGAGREPGPPGRRRLSDADRPDRHGSAADRHHARRDRRRRAGGRRRPAGRSTWSAEAEGAGGEAPSATVSVAPQLAAGPGGDAAAAAQLAQARHALAQLVGQAPADWTAPDFELAGFSAPADVPVSLPSSAGAPPAGHPGGRGQPARRHRRARRRHRRALSGHPADRQHHPDRDPAGQPLHLRRQRLDAGGGPDAADLQRRHAEGPEARGRGRGQRRAAPLPRHGAWPPSPRSPT